MNTTSFVDCSAFYTHHTLEEWTTKKKNSSGNSNHSKPVQCFEWKRRKKDERSKHKREWDGAANEKSYRVVGAHVYVIYTLGERMGKKAAPTNDQNKWKTAPATNGANDTYQSVGQLRSYLFAIEFLQILTQQRALPVQSIAFALHCIGFLLIHCHRSILHWFQHTKSKAMPSNLIVNSIWLGIKFDFLTN